MFSRYFLLFLFPMLQVFPCLSQKRDVVMNLITADKRHFNYGYFFGYAYHDFRIENKTNTPTILVTGGNGFNVGVMGEMKLTDFLRLRLEPGFFHAENTLLFPNFTEKQNAERVVQSTLIRLPMLLKFSANRFNNIRPFVMGGMSVNGNFSSKENSALDNARRVFRLKEFTYNYEVAVGVDFYTVFFKVALSMRGVFGMGNEFVPDKNPASPWTGNIQKLNSQTILFNITFE